LYSEVLPGEAIYTPDDLAFNSLDCIHRIQSKELKGKRLKQAQ